MNNVVIVGAGVAGVNAATKLVDNGFDKKKLYRKKKQNNIVNMDIYKPVFDLNLL